MDQFAYKPTPNKRTIDLGEYEIRKLWDTVKADFYYVLARRFREETCEMEGEGADAKPNWDNITDSKDDWGAYPQDKGDLDWAKRNAEHFGLEVPTEEFKQPEA